MRLATQLFALSILLMLTASRPPADDPRPRTTDDATPDPIAASRLSLPWLTGGRPSEEERYVAMDAAIDVDEGFAYMVSDGRLQVVDVRDPARPRRSGEAVTADLASEARSVSSVAASGGHAYVLDMEVNATAMREQPNTRLLTFDVTAPSAPRLVSSLDIQEIAMDMVVHDGWLYLPAWGLDKPGGARHAGLMVFDLSEPGQPRVHGFVELGFWAPGISRVGRRLLMTGAPLDTSEALDDRPGFRILDLGAPGSPALEDAIDADVDVNDWLRSVATVGDTAAAVSGGGIHLLDLAMPGSQGSRSAVGLGSGCHDPFIDATGQHFVVYSGCSGGDVLQVFAETRPASGRPVGVEAVGGLPMARRVDFLKPFHHPMHAADDGLVYLMRPAADTFPTELLIIVDISVPQEPKIVGRLP